MWEFSQIHKPHWSGSSLPPICNPPWEQPIFFPFSGSGITTLNVLSKAGPCGATAVSALKTHWILNKCTVSPVIICSVYHQSLAMIYVFVKSEEEKNIIWGQIQWLNYREDSILFWALMEKDAMRSHEFCTFALNRWPPPPGLTGIKNFNPGIFEDGILQNPGIF